jgi:hypothetical protein
VNTVLHSISHTVAVVALIALAAMAVYVVKALWVTIQTISEQRSDPNPSTPLLLTAGMVVTLAALAYLLYLTQGGGAA